MQPEELFATVFVTGMFLGVFIIFLGLRQRSLQLEMRHRERMAMIERGQIPLSDPALGGPRTTRALPAQRSSRSLSAGIITVGLGLAMMTIISIAGESPEVGVGVGGAIAVLGGAFIVRSLVARNDSQYAPDQFGGGSAGRPSDDPPL
ncbi:MAG TPA: hypothetical protein VF491_17895 [Vicinamibacterales bacterium]|jgi:hypothetical protein